MFCISPTLAGACLGHTFGQYFTQAYANIFPLAHWIQQGNQDVLLTTTIGALIGFCSLPLVEITQALLKEYVIIPRQLSQLKRQQFDELEDDINYRTKVSSSK